MNKLEESVNARRDSSKEAFLDQKCALRIYVHLRLLVSITTFES